MSSVAEILSRRRPLEKRVRLVLDGALVAEIEDARRRLTRLRTDELRNPQGLASAVPQLEAEVEDLQRRADDNAALFVFRAMPRAKLEEIKRRFPPSEQQWELWREQAKGNLFLSAPDFDGETAAPVIIAASAVEPAMSETEAQQLWDALSDGEAAHLFRAAWECNEEAASRPFYGNGTVTTSSSVPELTTPPSAESLSASS